MEKCIQIVFIILQNIVEIIFQNVCPIYLICLPVHLFKISRNISQKLRIELNFEFWFDENNGKFSNSHSPKKKIFPISICREKEIPYFEKNRFGTFVWKKESCEIAFRRAYMWKSQNFQFARRTENVKISICRRYV